MTTNHNLRCDGVNRRDFLHLGVLGAFGLTLANFFQLRSIAAGPSQKSPSCILIWLDGGPSHLDTFDPKPEAPAEIRSAFDSIPTTIPGIHICEHLPKTAKILKEIALIRSLTHELGNHDTGTTYLLTGHRPNPSLKYPSIGSLVAHQKGKDRALPPYVAIPNDRLGGQSQGAMAGYLPGAFSAFSVGNDPQKVRDLDPAEWISLERSNRRHDMLKTVDAFSRELESSPAVQNRDAFYEQAWKLMTSPEAKGAFDLSKENQPLLEAYGRSRIGQGCLLARRLIEAGSRFVTVVDTGWDTHQDIFRELPDSRFPGSGKLPNLDRAYSTLITDLKQRGLLENTLVVLMGEFGRTPKINADAGRDHWPRAGFACMAGGGVKGGQVIGKTDARGEEPSDRPVTPPDLFATLLHFLGVERDRILKTASGRPVPILSGGEIITELL